MKACRSALYWKGLPAMSKAHGVAPAKASEVKPSPALDEELLDWDVPVIDAPHISNTIQVRVREVDARPMLDI